jgi:hypothetical protein
MYFLNFSHVGATTGATTAAPFLCISLRGDALPPIALFRVGLESSVTGDAPPERGDTTSVSRPDTTSAQPTTPPSAGYDTTSTQPTTPTIDTTSEVGVRHELGDTTPTPRDTTPTPRDTTPTPRDTTPMPRDTTPMPRPR